MRGIDIVFWEEDGGWLGFPREYPDYWTQGDTPEDLKEHLGAIYTDLTTGQIPKL